MIAVANALLDYKFPSIKLPKTNVRFPLLNFVTKNLSKKKQGIFWSIVEDLIAAEKSGHIKKFAAATNKKEADRHNAPTENSCYFGVNSEIRKWQ